jgi:hypothetical protein
LFAREPVDDTASAEGRCHVHKSPIVGSGVLRHDADQLAFIGDIERIQPRN